MVTSGGTGPFRVAVFLSPADDDSRFVGAFIESLSARFATTPFEPHLTLCSGFCADVSALEEVVVGIAAATPPLTLRITGVGCDEAYFRTLYIELEGDALLTGLRKRLGTVIDRSRNLPYLPHLSLLYREMLLADKKKLAQDIVLDRSAMTFDSLKVVTPGNIREGWRDTLSWKSVCRVSLAG